MSERYLQIIQSTSLELLLTLPHKLKSAPPTGFVVKTAETLSPFPFTLCPLQFVSLTDPLPDGNPHDVIVEYESTHGELEELLYTLWETYRLDNLQETSHSWRRYRLTKTMPNRKIILPCFGRQENLLAVLKRFQQIDSPSEGYRPVVCIVEHSPYPTFEAITETYGCEYLWIFLDPRTPELPIGQFNKALCYDKAFLYTSPAKWYLLHDNDILVPRDFWARLDANVARTHAGFVQPFTKRSVMYTHKDVAERLRENLALADEEISDEMIQQPRIPGAPGGSLYLKRERYIEVGGHDPNYCWGYGPEDQFFFDKLKVIEPIAYADDPPIELLHLWHPTAQCLNPFRHEMDWFVKIFMRSKPEPEWREMMEGKKQLLLKLLASIQA